MLVQWTCPYNFSLKDLARAMFGPCWGNVSLALDQDNQEFSNFQDWVNLAQGTWKLDKLQFVCLLKQVKFFTVAVWQ